MSAVRPSTPTGVPRRPFGVHRVDSLRAPLAAAGTVAVVVASIAGGAPAIPRTPAPRPVAVAAPLASPAARVAMAAPLVAPEAASTALPVPAPTPTHAPDAVTVAAIPPRRTVVPTPRPSPSPSPPHLTATAPPATILPTPRATPVPQLVTNMLIGPDGLDTAVGIYTDCSGNTPLTHTEAAIDTCIAGPTYFVGHNYGVFTPLMSMSVGDIITWYDSSGVAHRMQIVSIRDGYELADGAPKPTEKDVVAQFQTCETYSPTGAYDRIIDTVNVGTSTP